MPKKKRKLPPITTKVGDNGYTMLWSGERVKKNHQAPRCGGKFDTFDSEIGVMYEYLDNYPELIESLIEIQKRLVYLKGELYTHPLKINEYKEKFEAIDFEDVEYIDQCCDNIREFLEKETDLTIDGWFRYGADNKVAARFDRLKNICRECESELYDLEDEMTNCEISVYIKNYVNRLSDYFYWLARYVSKV